MDWSGERGMGDGAGDGRAGRFGVGREAGLLREAKLSEKMPGGKRILVLRKSFPNAGPI
jgi:hypothetical protein